MLQADRADLAEKGSLASAPSPASPPAPASAASAERAASARGPAEGNGEGSNSGTGAGGKKPNDEELQVDERPPDSEVRALWRRLRAREVLQALRALIGARVARRAAMTMSRRAGERRRMGLSEACEWPLLSVGSAGTSCCSSMWAFCCLNPISTSSSSSSPSPASHGGCGEEVSAHLSEICDRPLSSVGRQGIAQGSSSSLR
mmetsp:Transcript_6538/g.24421  ORF Transcript_6538/g.24421 Transcript_6538/m.24421 type:complete len:203 (+) Transcript_6538:581-1189(+)